MYQELCKTAKLHEARNIIIFQMGKGGSNKTSYSLKVIFLMVSCVTPTDTHVFRMG